MENNNLTIAGLHSEDIWDFENGFYWFSETTRISKMLALYELYQKITNLPGHIFELGVYKGASFIRLCSFRQILENDHSRKIVGFDSFGTFPREYLSSQDDIKFIEKFEAAGGNGLDKETLQRLLERKNIQNFELVKGNVMTELDLYLDMNPETKLAMLHLDMDVQEPTSFALDRLYERIVPGGLIVIDDYNAVAGETAAVDEFVKERNLKIQKLPLYYVPAFVEKPL